jgi:hypothetical protein
MRCETCQGKGFREVAKAVRLGKDKLEWFFMHQPCEDCHAGQQSCCEGSDRDKGCEKSK